MKGIILAAGRGSRLNAMTVNQPKCLLKIMGSTLIGQQIKAFHDVGIADVAIVTGYKSEMLKKYGLMTFHNPDWDHTNMVYSLGCASSWLVSQPCIVSYADIFFDNSALFSLKNSKQTLAITYDVNWLELWRKRFGDPLIDSETFILNEKNELVEIGDRPVSLCQVQGQYMGLLRITPKSWNLMTSILKAMSTQMRREISMTQLLQTIIKKQQIKIHGIPFTKIWGEVDTESDLKVYTPEYFE